MLIQLFLKTPRPGTVKTRLAKTVGNEKACEIYKNLVAHQLQNLPVDADVEVHFAPEDAENEMRAWLGDEIRLIPQCDGDLGDRLGFAVGKAFDQGAPSVFCIGSDCPGLKPHHFYEAEKHLSQETNVVFGPTEDGGYYLVGVKAPTPCLFEGIPWSTEQTLKISLEHAASAGLKTALLETLTDVDTEEDWRRILTLLGSDTK